MDRTFRDIFVCETSWLFNINKVFKKLNCYDWFLENYKLQITVALHQATEKYFKYKLFKKYKLDDRVDFKDYSYLDNYSDLNILRTTHSLIKIYTEIKDSLDLKIIEKFENLSSILSECYISLRYPVQSKVFDINNINKEFIKDELKFLNILYTETGCSGLEETKNFFKEVRSLKSLDYTLENKDNNSNDLFKNTDMDCFSKQGV